MPIIRFRYSEALAGPDARWMVQRHGLVHDITTPDEHVTHLILQAAERRFTTWFAAEHTQSRLLRWEACPPDGGIYSIYECRLPSSDD